MNAKPPIRYVGGKSWLVERLVPEIEATKPHTYVEPFVGGGAIALALDRKVKKVLGDTSVPLVELWNVIRTMPAAIEREIRALEAKYDVPEDPISYAANINYLEARKAFNLALGHPRKFWVQRAALMLYINARCFNGLWRTNRNGKFNVPYGKLAKPRKITLEELREIAFSLENASIFDRDFQALMFSLASNTMRGRMDLGLLKGFAVFADSPYDGTYDGYSSDGFNEDQQRALANVLHSWTNAGANVWATNADTSLVREIYGGWAQLEEIDEQHSVGATGERRGKRSCLLIRGGTVLPVTLNPEAKTVITPVTSIAAKVAYVKSQGQTRAHHCHWPGCDAHVPPAMWSCRNHWFRLPKFLRDKIWRAYEIGQEVSMTPSGEYMDVMREVHAWIEKYGGV